MKDGFQNAEALKDYVESTVEEFDGEAYAGAIAEAMGEKAYMVIRAAKASRRLELICDDNEMVVIRSVE